MNDTQHTINAEGETLGRVASQAAEVLMGKNRSDFARNTRPSVRVYITNASRMNITQAKKDGTVYVRFSGYPGGQKRETLGRQIKTKGYEEVVRKAVYGMLPANRLRKDTMKRLVVTD